MKSANVGYIKSIRGSVIEAVFNRKLPEINNKLTAGKDNDIIFEVFSYVDEKTIQAVALTFTGGLSRDDEIFDSGSPIMVPVGKETLGKMFDVFGNVISDDEISEDVEKMSIHQKPLAFSKRSVSDEIFETGIKAIDVLTPLARGEKAGLFGGAGVGKRY